MENIKNHGWKLADLPTPTRGKVFSCFACGGGSSMGYKLAGYDLVGINEIDPEMAETYQRNAHPKYVFREPIQEFKLRDTYPQELLNLDILDGSPPCSTFSMAGSREKAWGKEKKFREGQAEQVLDTLFFDFVDLADRLKPKVVVAENVKGMLAGSAKAYLRRVFAALDRAGYDTQLFLFNGATMGVPQARERVFFVARRKDLNLSPIKLAFDEPQISFSEACADLPDDPSVGLTEHMQQYWRMTKPGTPFSKSHPRGSFFNWRRVHPNQPAPTVTATACMTHHKYPRRINRDEVVRVSTFPDDYDFGKNTSAFATYVCGMSVPPRMVERIANQIWDQWLSKL